MMSDGFEKNVKYWLNKQYFHNPHVVSSVFVQFVYLKRLEYRIYVKEQS
jgi:hypothetical protein